MKKVWHAIVNFFKLLFLTLISPFVKNKKEETKEESKTIKSEKITAKKEIKPNITDPAALPDEDNMKSNPHDETNDTGETESTRIYTLPKQLGRILEVNEKYSYLAFSDEEIDLLIDDVLEDKYKEDGFKVYKANNIMKKKIEKLKKEIVPKIKDKIYYNNITNEKKLKKEIEEILDEQLILTPLFEDKKPKKKEEPYFLAHTKKTELELPALAIDVKKEDIILDDAKPEEKETVEEKINIAPVRMVQETDEIKEPSIVEDIPKLAVATTIAVAKGAVDVVTTDLKEEPKKDDEKKIEEEVKEEIDTPIEEIPTEDEKEEIKEEIESIEEETEEIEKEVEELEITLEEIIEDDDKEDEKELEEAEEEKEEEEEIEEEIKKDIALEIKVHSLDYKTSKTVSEAEKEANKSDFFEKDYDAEEKRIDDMLDKISDTKIKYAKKLTPEQKARLDKQEAKLRDARERLDKAKTRDIDFEKRELEQDIRKSELDGLQKEIKDMHIEYDMQTNNNVLKKMEKLEGMTKEEVNNADKKIMMSRFNKASFLLEMSSLLAFPFVRNKYFRLFTIGLVVDNHLGFAHAWLNRKANRYQPADLNRIKKGQDALDGALDLAYKDLVELDYIEEQATTRNPALKDDPAYQASINRVRNNLNNQYKKLMKKKTTMEKYMSKGKRQKKILERKEAAA